MNGDWRFVGLPFAALMEVVVLEGCPSLHEWRFVLWRVAFRCMNGDWCFGGLPFTAVMEIGVMENYPTPYMNGDC